MTFEELKEKTFEYEVKCVDDDQAIKFISVSDNSLLAEIEKEEMFSICLCEFTELPMNIQRKLFKIFNDYRESLINRKVIEIFQNKIDKLKSTLKKNQLSYEDELFIKSRIRSFEINIEIIKAIEEE